MTADLTRFVRKLKWRLDGPPGCYPQRYRADQRNCAVYSVAGSENGDDWHWYRNGYLVGPQPEPMSLEAVKAAAEKHHADLVVAGMDADALGDVVGLLALMKGLARLKYGNSDPALNPEFDRVDAILAKISPDTQEQET